MMDDSDYARLVILRFQNDPLVTFLLPMRSMKSSTRQTYRNA